jgi:hypothetical protein
MAQKIIITAKSVANPLGVGTYNTFVFANALGTYFSAVLLFDSDPTNINIGVGLGKVKYNQATTDLVALDIKAFFDLQLTLVSVPFTSEIVGNVVTYYLGNNATVDTFVGNGASSIDVPLIDVVREDYTFPTEPSLVTYEDNVILSRSPYFFKATPTVLYDSMLADIYIYRGEKTADIPATPTFQTSKFVIQAGQPIVSIDIHKLVNDFVQNEFTQNVSLGVQTTNQLDSVWVYIDAGIYLENVLLYSINQTLLALDGFGYHQELANPAVNKKVLSTINNHIVYNGSKYPLYFYSKDLVSITINGNVVPFTLDENYNNQFIAYVDVMQYAGVDTSFDIEFEYTTETIIHSIQVKTECRNELVNCIFKNKYGFWQKIGFNKLSKLNLDIDSSDYNPFISDFGSYNLNQHTKRSYLTNGNEKIVVNTDFLPEEYNLLFKELMLSEQIYLEQGATILPVNLNKKSFAYKTKLNDKLIQYSMDFEYSFKTINNIV